MRPETLKAVKNQWTFCSIAMQTYLIKRYREDYGRNNNDVWFDFLAREFGLLRTGSGSSSIFFTRENRTP